MTNIVKNIVFDRLHQSVKKNNFSHFYIFYGPKNIGKKRLALDFSKSILCDSIGENNSCNELPLIIPINIAIFSGNNEKITKTLVLKEKEEEFSIENIKTNFQIPIVTYFRSFSAPVEWESDQLLNILNSLNFQ